MPQSLSTYHQAKITFLFESVLEFTNVHHIFMHGIELNPEVIKDTDDHDNLDDPDKS